MEKEDEIKRIAKELSDIINHEIEKDGLDNVVEKYDLNKVDRYSIQNAEFNGKMSKAIEILAVNNKRFIIQDENDYQLDVKANKSKIIKEEVKIEYNKPKLYFKSDMYGTSETTEY
jgi:hypothetical protein